MLEIARYESSMVSIEVFAVVGEVIGTSLRIMNSAAMQGEQNLFLFGLLCAMKT